MRGLPSLKMQIVPCVMGVLLCCICFCGGAALAQVTPLIPVTPITPTQPITLTLPTPIPSPPARVAPSTFETGFLTSESSMQMLERYRWLEATDGTWHSESDLCLIKEFHSSQKFTPQLEWDTAYAVALLINRNLVNQKLQNVSTETLPRPEQWGILAQYQYLAEGSRFQAYQLYLADENGKLHTYTGSSAESETDPCVDQMVRFLKFAAF
jgi:hypothetical protein